MNRIALILTAAAYLLSFGCYMRFLNTGRELIGRLGTLFLALGFGGALFRASREVAWTAYCAVSRFVWIDVAVRLVAGSLERTWDWSCITDSAPWELSSLPFILVFLSRGAPCAGGPAARNRICGEPFSRFM